MTTASIWGSSSPSAVLPTSYGVVSSIAALRAISKLSYAYVLVLGYYAATSDGGGGQYYYDPTDTVSADNGGTVIVASDGGRWKLIYKDYVTAKQFGAKIDGVTDDTARLQAWLTAGGGWLNAGNTVVSGQLSIPGNSKIFGAGPKVSVINCAAGYNGNVLSIEADEVSVKNIGINAPSVRSAGSYIIIAGAYRSNVIEDIWMSMPYRGISITGDSVLTNINRIEIINLAGTTGVGIHVDGGNDTYISNTLINSEFVPQPLYGLYITKTGAVWCYNVGGLKTGAGIKVAPPSGKTVTWCFFTACAFDTCTNEAISVSPTGTGSIRGLQFDNCWGATSDRGVYIDQGASGNVDGVEFNGCRFFNNNKQGSLVLTGVNIFFNACKFRGNGQAVINTYAGCEFSANCAGFGVRDCVSGSGDGFGAQHYSGISVGAGCNSYIITDNDLEGNATIGLLDNSVATSSVRTVRGNIGHKTYASGASAATDGGTVNHGLVSTPLTVRANPTTAGEMVSITAKGATTFTTAIKKHDNTAGTNQTIYWEADVY
jgi:hypothetical protein